MGYYIIPYRFLQGMIMIEKPAGRQDAKNPHGKLRRENTSSGLHVVASTTTKAERKEVRAWI